MSSNALLGSHGKEVVEAIVREAPVTQVEHTDAIFQKQVSVCP